MLNLRLWTAVSSKRHAAKGPGVNADAATATSRYAAVFDGVSGVPPPFKPEDMSFDLRNQFVTEMETRFNGQKYVQEYDRDVRLRLYLLFLTPRHQIETTMH